MALAIDFVLLAAFEPDAGAVPGELTHWIASHALHTRVELPAAYRALYSDGGGMLALATGVGSARAAASVMALGTDPRFDLTRAFFLITGVAGVAPSQGTLASVVLPEYVVDGDLTHELDAREIPENDPAWPDGFVPIGKSVPYEEPRAARFDGDDGIVFRLDPGLVGRAYELSRDTPLVDTPELAARRAQFAPLAGRSLEAGPSVVRGDELASSTFFHGRMMSERAARHVAYQTDGKGTYAITAMEDAGMLQALTWLGAAKRVDVSRVVIARGASNFDQQRLGLSAAESLAETRVATYSAYRPALENAHRVGARIVEALLRDGTTAAR